RIGRSLRRNRHRKIQKAAVDQISMRSFKLQIVTLVLTCSTLVCADSQRNAKHKKAPPRFTDFPVAAVWQEKTVAVKIRRPSEKMFRTRLRDAARERPNFAGHYRFVIWGCGSECILGAIIDLRNGDVFSPPL